MIQGYDNEILQLEMSKVDVDLPNKEIMELKLKFAISAERQKLCEAYQQKFVKRVKKEQRVRERLEAALEETRAQASASGLEASGTEDDQKDDGVDASPDAWVGSPEERKYMAALAKVTAEATEVMEREYVEEYTQAQLARKGRNQGLVRISELKSQIVRVQVTELMVTELKNLKTIIISKVLVSTRTY